MFGKLVDEDLNLIDFGTYSDLCDVLATDNHIQLVSRIIEVMYPDLDEGYLTDTKAADVWGYANWVIKEIGRINELFGSIKVEYTEQEKKAGIDSVQFGTFGILDWYAKRMGIRDQNEVNKTKWVRIWQCMKNDSEEAKFNRRLQKVYEQEMKRKH